MPDNNADDADWVFGSFTLLPFQRECVDKLAPVRASLIGDDMGLGKTVEAIALDVVRRRRAGTGGYPEYMGKAARRVPTLVVAPLSPLSDAWAGTYPQAAPDLRVAIVDTKNRSAFVRAVAAGKHDIYLVHWQALRLMPELAELATIGKAGWFNIIADECHRIKNRKAVQTRHFKLLKPTIYKTGLSGTPADNKPSDIWSILNWLYPDKYRAYWTFYKRHVEFEMKETQEGNKYQKVSGVKNVEELHREMAPYFVRRRKEQVLKDLPDKYYTTMWVDLSPTQRRAYNDMRRKMLAWVGENDDKPLAAPMAIAKLQRLQMFSVAHVDTVKVWKWFIDKDESSPTFGERIRKQVDKGFNIEPSSKCDQVMEVLDAIDPVTQPLIVFTQFRNVVMMLQARLRKVGIEPSVLVGGMNTQERGDAVNWFQQGKRPVFLTTIPAGGEGITLHRSSTEMFLDRAWSPAQNRQAEDRAHRIGQKNAVQVIDVVARNTVDFGRIQEFKMKWSWIQQILGDNTLDYQESELKGKERDAEAGLIVPADTFAPSKIILPGERSA